MCSQIYCIKVAASRLFKAFICTVCAPFGLTPFLFGDLGHLGTPNWLIILLLSLDALMILGACGT